jgi:hypothetical protein
MARRTEDIGPLGAHPCRAVSSSGRLEHLGINCSDSNIPKEHTMAYPKLDAEDVKTLTEIAQFHVRENLEEYWRTFPRVRLERSALHYDNNSYIEQDSITGYKTLTTISEYQNWREIKNAYDFEQFEEEMLKETVRLAQEVAFTVEYQIRQVAQYRAQTSKGNYRYLVPSLRMLDLFNLESGEPNLKFNFVMQTPMLLDESYLGWVAYKFKFAIFD